jgi:hypothetical protein
MSEGCTIHSFIGQSVAMMLFAIVLALLARSGVTRAGVRITPGHPGRTSFQATVHRNMNAWLGPVWVQTFPETRLGGSAGEARQADAGPLAERGPAGKFGWAPAPGGVLLRFVPAWIGPTRFTRRQPWRQIPKGWGRGGYPRVPEAA